MPASQDLYQSIFESSQDYICVWKLMEGGRPGKFITVNPATCARVGYTQEELLQLTPLDVTSNACKEKFPQDVRLLLDPEVHITEWEVITKTGEVIPVEINSNYLNKENQDLVVSVIRDISERKRLESQLREKVKVLQLLNQQLPIIAWTTDTQLKFTSRIGATATDEARKIFEDFGNKSIGDYFSTDDPDYPVAVAHKTALQGKEARYEYIGPRGGVYDCIVEPFIDEMGEIIGTVGVAIDVTQRVNTEKALRENQEYLRFVTGRIPGLIWTTDRENRCTSILGAKSHSGMKMQLDGQNGDCRGKFSGIDCMWQASAEKHPRVLAGECVEFEVPGNDLHWKCVMEPLRNDKGESIGTIASAIDITSESKLLKELSQSESKLRILINHVPAMIWMTDADLTITHISGGSQIGDIEDNPQQYIGQTIPDYLQDKQEAALVLQAHLAALQGARREMEVYHLDRYWYMVMEPLYRQDTIAGVIGLALDISEQRKSEIFLRQNQEYLELIISQMPANLWTVDRNLRVISSFKGDQVKVSLVDSKDSGTTLYNIFQNNETSFMPINAHLKALQGCSQHFEYNDKGVDFAVVVEPLHDEEGKIVGAIGVSFDITHQKTMERSLLAKNKELDDFSYMVSHELKAPLATIGGYLQMAREEPELFGEIIPRLDAQIDHLTHMINSLLNLSRAGRIINFMQDIDLNLALREAFVTCTFSEENVQLVIPEPLPTIQGDPERWIQLLDNIISNAVSCRDPLKDNLVITARCSKENGILKLSISDNGIGIHREHKDRIFVPSFTTRKNEGTGFGLSIARKIVEAHNGKIWAESQGINQGSTFYIQLPEPVQE